MTDPIAIIERLRKAYEEKKPPTPETKTPRVYEYLLSDTPSPLIYFAPGVDMIEAERSLRDKFGERLISVREKI